MKEQKISHGFKKEDKTVHFELQVIDLIVHLFKWLLQHQEQRDFFFNFFFQTGENFVFTQGSFLFNLYYFSGQAFFQALLALNFKLKFETL